MANGTDWAAVLGFGLMVIRWLSRTDIFGDPPAEPAPREEIIHDLNDRIDEGGLAYRGRLVEDPPGSGRFRAEA